jgi:predicted nucleotidyltransferase
MRKWRPAAPQTLHAEDPALAEAVRRLVEAYRPNRIYLFGSVARGEAGPDSDYDIMVLVPDGSEPERRDCDLAYRTLRGLRIAKDVLVWPQADFDKRLHLKASFPSTILREGKLLYAA